MTYSKLLSAALLGGLALTFMPTAASADSSEACVDSCMDACEQLVNAGFGGLGNGAQFGACVEACVAVSCDGGGGFSQFSETDFDAVSAALELSGYTEQQERAKTAAYELSADKEAVDQDKSA